MDNFETKQKENYNKIITDYDLHYNDKYSQKYRRRFLYNPLFSGIDFKGKRVLEAMCGAGSTTEYLISRGAKVVALDISPKAIEILKSRWPEIKTVTSSIINSKLDSESFDYIIIDGGLHHIHPNVNEGIEEVKRLLRPGGLFFFLEPHSDSFFDKIRKIWYSKDELFSENEAAVDLTKMKNDFSSDFDFIKEIYVGGPAYLFVFNSMVFRISPKLKFIYSDIFMFIDFIISFLIGRRSSFKVLCCWRKHSK